VKLASAPVSWGVWERTVARHDLVAPEQLLEAVRWLGYRAIELGPLGYFGADRESVRALLGRFELELVGAFVPLQLSEDDDFRDLAATIEILRGWPAVVLLADAGTPERFAAAGRPDELRRTALRGAALDRAVARLASAADRCRDAGLPAALHPEVGSYVEAPAEIETFLERVDIDLCLDTGHTLIGSGDPLELAREWRERVRHVHLKDVSGPLLARLRAGELDVEAAWEQGLFCPFGEGEVDLDAVLAELEGFPGWLVLEQDRVAVRPKDLEAVRQVEQRNLAFVCDRVPVSVGSSELTKSGGAGSAGAEADSGARP
jgi:inosose dehydratase